MSKRSIVLQTLLRCRIANRSKLGTDVGSSLVNWLGLAFRLSGLDEIGDKRKQSQNKSAWIVSSTFVNISISVL